MAIAQLIIEKICFPILEEVEDLDHTERGEKGFGSTSTEYIYQQNDSIKNSIKKEN